MENEKNVEDIKKENDLLTQQLQALNEKMKELGSILIEAKERNVKLAYSTRLFAETHLTREEKLAIAQEIDRAVSAEQVDKIYNKYIEQICPPGTEVEQDFLWSPGFVRDIEKYYFKYKGYNPFEVIDEGINEIRLQFKIEDSIRITDDPEKLKQLKESWQINREEAISAIDEILSVTNQISKK